MPIDGAFGRNLLEDLARRDRVHRVGERAVREAEVEHLHVPVGAHHHVLGLDVTVHHASPVRCAEGAGQLARDVECAFHRQRRRHEVTQRPARHELLHHQQVARVRFENLVDRDDARVVEGRRRTGLLEEVVGRHPGPQRGRAHDLDGDEPIEAGVLGAIDLAHSSAPQQGVNPVLLTGRADHRAQSVAGLEMK